MLREAITERPASAKRQRVRVIEWTVQRVLDASKQALGLDTWETNIGLRRYYESQGFRHIGVKSFPLESPLRLHYRGASMNLFERRIQAMLAVD